MTKFYLLFDRVIIQAANALASPLTYGFPAINGFVGAIHALQRRLPQDFPLTLDGVLIAAHQCDTQTFQADEYSDATFIQSRNPLKKDGSTASIIEEGKVNLTVSLAVEAYGDHNTVLNRENELAHTLQDLLYGQRIAGGSVLHIEQTQIFQTAAEADLKTALYPAYILTDAQDDLDCITEELRCGYRIIKDSDGYLVDHEDEPTGLTPNPDATPLDAVLATAQFFHIPPNQENGDWRQYHIRQNRGWLVPISIGFQGISAAFAAGKLQHSRNPEYPSQYVEAVYSLGKWQFPNKLSDGLTHCFWRYDEPQENLYLLTTSPRKIH